MQPVPAFKPHLPMSADVRAIANTAFKLPHARSTGGSAVNQLPHRLETSRYTRL